MIGITGGTGFIGHHLCDLLLSKGYKVIVFTRDMHKLTRRESVKYTYWNPDEGKFDLSYFDDIIAVINLAGAGLADKRWTEKRKQEIIRSRVHSTQFLIERLREHAPNCKTLISASAINYYGADRTGYIPFREEAPAADDFLGTVCRQWEATTYTGADFLRTVIFRFGMVLGKDDGAFPRLADPQSIGIIPIIGSGRQVMSWIHISDLCRMLVWAVMEESVQGVFNAVAPYPVSLRRMMMTIAKEKGGVKIPVHVPNRLLSWLLGEMPQAVIKSLCVSAEKVQEAGFSFRYPTIGEAVKNILHQAAMDKHNRSDTRKEE